METVFLYDTDACDTAQVLKPLEPRLLRDASQLKAAFAGGGELFVITFHARDLLRALADLRPRLSPGARLLLFDEQTIETDFFTSVFSRVVVARNGFLPKDELVEVLSAPNAADLFIGGRVDRAAGILLLYRGNLERVMVPLANFKPTIGGPRPDVARFAIADHGQTIKLGDYEASSEAVLYEIDGDFRRRLRERRRKEDKGFGPSLRRLRIQRGLRQSDFPGITEKEIGRIERGEVAKPHDSTLLKIAARLDVTPEEIEEY